MTAVEAALAAFSRPFIETTVHELARCGQRLVYDLDLMGQAVSATSTTYPEAAFGGMNDQLRLSYQLARLSLSSPAGPRIWLAGFHHPGDTVSSAGVQELLYAPVVSPIWSVSGSRRSKRWWRAGAAWPSSNRPRSSGCRRRTRP